MKKLLTAVLMITAVAIFAASGKGYRVYGEEIHSTPDANFHVEEVDVKK